MGRLCITIAGISIGAGLLLSLAFCRRAGAQQAPENKSAAAHTLQYPGEKHLANIRQLTFGGESAEAYFSADDKFLTFQHQGQFFDPATRKPVGPNIPCDQIFTMPVPTAGEKPAQPKMLSNGQGRTTCSYFFPSGDRM